MQLWRLAVRYETIVDVRRLKVKVSTYFAICIPIKLKQITTVKSV